jgi:hypothetical protein
VILPPLVFPAGGDTFGTPLSFMSVFEAEVWLFYEILKNHSFLSGWGVGVEIGGGGVGTLIWGLAISSTCHFVNQHFK